MKLLIKILLTTIVIGCQPKTNSESELEISQFFEGEINQTIYGIKRTITQFENNKQKSFSAEDLQRNPLIRNFDQIESLVNHQQFEDAYHILIPNKRIETDKLLRFSLYKMIQHYYRDMIMITDVQDLNEWSITPLSLNVRDTIRFNTLNYGYIENNEDEIIDTTYTRKLELTVNNQTHEIIYGELPFVSLPSNKLGINTTSLSYKFTNVITGSEMSKTVTKKYYVK